MVFRSVRDLKYTDTYKLISSKSLFIDSTIGFQSQYL